MANDRQRTCYTLDVDEVAEAIREMNSSRTAVAADCVLHRAFPSLAEALDPDTIEKRVLLVDGLWRTRLFMEPGAVERISENLRREGSRLVPLLRNLGPDNLEEAPNKVYEAAKEVVPVVLNQSPDPDDGYRQNYSFASKFFHWCTRCHFPIVDGNARQAINALQNRHRVRPVVRKDTAEIGGLAYIDEYERWVRFYSDLIHGLGAEDRRRLEQLDFDTLPQPYRFKNSLLRILDKYFWWRGGRGNA